jgi:Zn-dependent protease
LSELPSFDELPVADGKPAHSSWGLWGDDDVLGCLNLLDVERGLGCARKGAVFALNASMQIPDPPLFNRQPHTHEVHETAVSADDVLNNWNTQASAQWDGFRHIRHPVHGHYNGKQGPELGIDYWATRGLVGRGVLADVARWREDEGRPITPNASDPVEPDDITGTLRAQGTEMVPGDVLCVRTGWLAWYKGLDEGERRSFVESGHPCAGLRPGLETARTLWDLHVAAVAADNPSLEVWPPGALLTDEQRQAMRDDPSKGGEAFVHFYLLPLLVGSMVLHELAHAVVATRLGDPTPEEQGRLTLNPIVHLDPLGTAMFGITYWIGGFIFGWAKPVLVQPRHFRHPQGGMALVAVAGPITNFLIAVGTAAVLVHGDFGLRTAQVLELLYRVNVILGIFNLLPIPPLDGSRIVAAFLSPRAYAQWSSLDQYGMFILFGVIIFLRRPFFELMASAFNTVTEVIVILVGG